jgi:hypothetical protein
MEVRNSHCSVVGDPKDVNLLLSLLPLAALDSSRALQRRIDTFGMPESRRAAQLLMLDAQ